MEPHAAFAPDGSPRGAERASGRTKNIELDYRDTWRETLSKLRSQVSARKMMKNISAFSPKLLRVIKKNQKNRELGKGKKKSGGWRLLYSAESGRIKVDEERMRETLWTRTPRSGADYRRLRRSHRFHEANNQSSSWRKRPGRRDTRGQARGGKKKGGEWEMKIYVREEERADRSARVHVRMCVSMYIFMQQLSGCHFDFKGSVPPLWNSAGQLSSGLIFHTAAN